jgi:hypothetical protein
MLGECKKRLEKRLFTCLIDDIIMINTFQRNNVSGAFMSGARAGLVVLVVVAG